MKTALSLLFTLALISGCDRLFGGSHDSPSPSPAPSPAPQPSPEQKAQSSCDSMKALLTDPQTVEMPSYTQTMIRRYQRIQRYDCSGNMTSDQIEPIDDERFGLTLENPTETPFVAVAVIADKTCAQAVSSMPIASSSWSIIKVSGDGKHRIQLSADLADALLTFHLDTDQNYLTVRFFHDCYPNDVASTAASLVGNPNCASSTNFTTAHYPIDVQYSEVTVSGIQVIRPDPESCKPPKK